MDEQQERVARLVRRYKNLGRWTVVILTTVGFLLTGAGLAPISTQAAFGVGLIFIGYVIHNFGGRA